MIEKDTRIVFDGWKGIVQSVDEIKGYELKFDWSKSPFWIEHQDSESIRLDLEYYRDIKIDQILK